MWLLVLSGGLSVSAADDLGRLFFTPEERAALDAAARPPSLPPAAEVPAAAGLVPRVVPPATVTLDGVLSGPAGAAHVWVNGQGGVPADLPALTGGSARLQQGALELDGGLEGPLVHLKPGQTYRPLPGGVTAAGRRTPPPP